MTSEQYQRKLARFKARQANKRRLARNLKSKWYQRRRRADKRMDEQARRWLDRDVSVHSFPLQGGMSTALIFQEEK